MTLKSKKTVYVLIRTRIESANKNIVFFCTGAIFGLWYVHRIFRLQSNTISEKCLGLKPKWPSYIHENTKKSQFYNDP